MNNLATGIELTTLDQLSLLGSCIFGSNVEEEIANLQLQLSVLCVSLPAHLGSSESNRKVVKSFSGENYTLDEDFVESLNLLCEDSGSEQAVSTRESGAWLNAIPIAFVGTLRGDSKDCSVPETWGDRGTIGTPWSRLSAIRRKVHPRHAEVNACECAQHPRAEQSLPTRWL
ncbi:hypothetical protein ACOME3_006030 [Neoechinorhynchus agilis]